MGSPKRPVPLSVLVALCLALTPGCGATTPIGTVERDMEEKAALEPEVQQDATTDEAAPESEEPVDATRNTRIADVIADPVLGEWGRLLFPVDRGYVYGSTLGDLQLTWYMELNPQATVDVVNDVRRRASAGEIAFIDIYSNAEKATDPRKADTGLFFFPGEPGAPTAIVNAGGGFAYVGAMQDSFPHCLELSRRGFNAFALIYRPGAQTACEDLARAIAVLHERAGELDISMDGYSLWGGSAGARMAAWLSSERIEELLVLDVKPASYFTDQGFVDQHGGGAALFARDAEIMGWLFGK